MWLRWLQHVAAARDKHPLQNFMLEWWNKSYLAGRCVAWSWAVWLFTVRVDPTTLATLARRLRYANPINVNPFLGFASHVCQPNQVLMAAAITHHTAKFVHVRV